ncbi:MAG: hypothetical protein NTY57_00285 [Solirubrobacterales bacterium]|nr:hypothetical protein [Solirubrobacterales bacterium]
MTCSRLGNTVAFTLVCLALTATAGCGSGSKKALTEPGPVLAAVTDAETVNLADFPKGNAGSLSDIAATAMTQDNFAQATSIFTPGTNRLAFGVIGNDGKPAYGPTVVYLARSPQGPAKGPFAAPADPMVPQAAYLSKGAASETDELQAIYEAQIPTPTAGKWFVVTLTKTAEGLAQTSGEIDVAPNSTIPNVGDRAPSITTETVSSTGGNIAAIDTRKPPAPSLHQQNFASVLGKAPIALLFATPQLCQSRVCGPVTDILLQLQANYGASVVAIHEEVYKENKPPTLRPQLEAFGLVTEPWLFTVGRDGRIKARLEGAFGINAMNRAIEAALK